MSTGLFLLPAIAAGYWFLSSSNFSRFRLERSSGYHLFLVSTLCGTILYGLSHILLSALGPFYSGEIKAWAGVSPELLPPAVQTSILLAFLAPYPLNLLFSRTRQALKVALSSGEMIERALEEAATGPYLVEVSLKSRKVYVGVPLHSGIGNASDSDIELVPVYSGYRDEMTLELVLTLDYRQVITKLVESDTPLELNDFRVIFPVSEISSVRPFEDEIFDAFDDSDEDIDY